MTPRRGRTKRVQHWPIFVPDRTFQNVKDFFVRRATVASRAFPELAYDGLVHVPDANRCHAAAQFILLGSV
jgi:hypothetical protein